MATLTDAAKIEEHLCVSTATATEIAKRIRLAELYLRSLKGDTWYDDTLALPAGDQAREDAEEAESLIAFYFALPHLNLRIDDNGGILLQEWTDDGAGGRLQKVFATMPTLELVRRELLSQARCLVYSGPTIDYEDTEQTSISGVRELGPLLGISFAAVIGD